MQFAPVEAAAYAKLHQRASHYAIVGVAAALDVKGGEIQSARIGLTGATTHARSADGRRAGARREAGDDGDDRERPRPRAPTVGRRQLATSTRARSIAAR